MKYRLKKSKTRMNKIFGVGVIVLGLVTVVALSDATVLLWNLIFGVSLLTAKRNLIG